MNEVLAALMTDSVVRSEMDEVDSPHVMLCTDLNTGFISVAGPFPDGFAALVAAEQDAATLATSEAYLEFRVLPLYPPLPAA